MIALGYSTKMWPCGSVPFLIFSWPTDLRWYNCSKKETEFYSRLVPFKRKWAGPEKSYKFNSRQQSLDRHSCWKNRRSVFSKKKIIINLYIKQISGSYFTIDFSLKSDRRLHGKEMERATKLLFNSKLLEK